MVKKYVISLSAALAALGGVASAENVKAAPQEASDVSVGRQFHKNQNTNALFEMPVGEDLMSFGMHSSIDGILLAYHSSHASHVSHASHASSAY